MKNDSPMRNGETAHCISIAVVVVIFPGVMPVFFHSDETFQEGFFGDFLKFEIERGVDCDSTFVKFRVNFGKILPDVSEEIFYEVGRFIF